MMAGRTGNVEIAAQDLVEEQGLTQLDLGLVKVSILMEILAGDRLRHGNALFRATLI